MPAQSPEYRNRVANEQTNHIYNDDSMKDTITVKCHKIKSVCGKGGGVIRREDLCWGGGGVIRIVELCIGFKDCITTLPKPNKESLKLLFELSKGSLVFAERTHSNFPT